MNEPKVGKVGESVRFGQVEHTKLEQDAMLAEAGEEDELIKCFDDITGRELPWQAVKEARERSCNICVNLACVKRSMSAQLWQSTDKAFEGRRAMQIRSGIVAREFKSGDRPDFMLELPRWKL